MNKYNLNKRGDKQKNMTIKSAIKFQLIFIVLSIASGCEDSVEPKYNYPIENQLKKGEYSVGYQYFNIPDFSKKSETSFKENRLVSFGVWYPAKSSRNTQPMQYVDYLKTSTSDIKDSILQKYVNQKSFLGETTPSILDSNLQITTNATFQAPPIERPFPLVIYAGKANDEVFGNSVLFEFLSSHGYIVLSVPPIPPSNGGEDMALNNYNDICFAINKLKRTFPQCNVTEIATIGYEIGGNSTASLAIGNAHVKAHISLNGAIGSWFGWQFSDHLFYNDFSDLRVPVLHFGTNSYEKSPDNTMGESTFETADSIKNANLYFYYLSNTVPIGVSSHNILSWILPLSKVKEEYQVNKEGVIEDYQRAMETTLLFLNVYLNKSQDITSLEHVIRKGHNRNFVRPQPK